MSLDPILTSSTKSASHGVPGPLASLGSLSMTRGMQKLFGKTQKKRVGRNNRYRYALRMNKLSDATRAKIETNPEGYGAPRSYTLSFADTKVNAPIESKIHFGNFGNDGCGIMFDGQKIDPAHVRFSKAGKTCTWETKLGVEHKNATFAGHLNFASANPSGVVSVNNNLHNVVLKPDISYFDTKVSANTNAWFDANAKQFKWDPTNQDTWTNATWENNLVFGYDTVYVQDLVSYWVVENYFIDTCVTPNVPFNLTKDEYQKGYYASSLTTNPDPTKPDTMLTSVMMQIPSPPSQRQSEQVKTVFPSDLNFSFSPYGDSFTGAYHDVTKNIVYAASGTVQQSQGMLPLGTILTSMVAQPSVQTSPSLNIITLLGNDVMVPDSTDPTGFKDSISELAMQDFYNIIIYYMDDDLRQTFFTQTPADLTAAVLQVATDDNNSGENSTFYKKLQVPYIASVLANNVKTIPEGSQCNGVRSSNRLQTVPENDPVYKRHASKLYRMHYSEKFPNINQFVADQASGGKNNAIDKLCTGINNMITQKCSDATTVNPNAPAELQRLLDDNNLLAQWAKNQNLYWAYALLYTAQTHTVPQWFTEFTNGTYNTPSLSTRLKIINLLFDNLEGDLINPSPNGKTFAQTFNETVRWYSMAQMVPQLIDINGNQSDLDSMFKECLQQFWQQYANSQDPDLVKMAASAQELFQQDQTRENIFKTFTELSNLSAGFFNWYEVITTMDQQFANIDGVAKLQNTATAFAVFAVITGAILFTMSLLEGNYSTLTPEQKTACISSVIIIGGYIGIKLVQGVIRLKYFWDDLKGFWECIKVGLGYESEMLANIERAAGTIPNVFMRFFARTSAQTQQIMDFEQNPNQVMEAMDETADSIKVNENFVDRMQFSKFEKLFGRNMGELGATAVGLLLAGIGIYLAVKGLASDTGLLWWSDMLFLFSCCIQVLSVVVGWVASFLGAAASTLSLIGWFGGIFAIVLCIVGIVLWLVWYFTADHRDPAQKFVDDYVKPQGLYMDHLAIDYYKYVPPKNNAPSLNGLSFVVNGSFMQVDTTATTTSLTTSTSYIYTSNMLWYIQTDGYGNTLISVNVSSNDGFKLYYLSVSGSNVQATELPQQDANYDTAIKQYQWNFSMLSDPTLNSDGLPLNGTCTIQQNNQYLTMGQGQISLSPIPMTWQITMEPLAPASLSYVKNPWNIALNTEGDINKPMFSYGGFSSGLQWSISPSLPSFLTLLQPPDAGEGELQMLANTKPTVMPLTTYTVTCALPITTGGIAHSITTSTTVGIEVPTSETRILQGK